MIRNDGFITKTSLFIPSVILIASAHAMELTKPTDFSTVRSETNTSNEIVQTSQQPIQPSPELQSRICKLYICLLCNEVYKTSNELNVHKQNHDIVPQQPNPYLPVFDQTISNYDTFTELLGQMNSNNAQSITSLSEHACSENNGQALDNQSNTTISTPSQSETITSNLTDQLSQQSNQILPKLQSTNRKMSECSICGKMCTSSTGLTKHKRTHTGERPFACRFCKRSFAQCSQRNRHEQIHSGKKPFSCNFCDKCFNRKLILINHERTHTGQRPFICQTCKTAFSRKEYLEDHERIHTNQKPFACQFCSKTFSTSSNCTRHERTCQKK